MKQLITIKDYAIKLQKDELLTDADKWDLLERYIVFVFLPVTMSMFFPIYENGNWALIEPDSDDYMKDSNPDRYVIDCERYDDAVAGVLFIGWKLVSKDVIESPDVRSLIIFNEDDMTIEDLINDNTELIPTKTTLTTLNKLGL